MWVTLITDSIHTSGKGYGSTDLRLDISTEKTKFN